MPDQRKHRGPHPRDAQLFSAERIPALRTAAHDYAWLLSRGYTSHSALKLVGDRYELVQRQRIAVARGSCSLQARQRRQARARPLVELAGSSVAIDGFNCLITTEVALSGGVVLRGLDGAYRDLASVHGTYRSVEETEPAARLLIEALQQAKVGAALWLLDRPVSNSGRLAEKLRTWMAQAGTDWTVELVPDADRALAARETIALSSDSWVLDHTKGWFDLPGQLIDHHLHRAWVVDLRKEPGAAQPHEDSTALPSAE